MNFKRFLLLAVFLMAPGITFAGITINDFTVTSNVHQDGMEGFAYRIRFF